MRMRRPIRRCGSVPASGQYLGLLGYADQGSSSKGGASPMTGTDFLVANLEHLSHPLEVDVDGRIELGREP